MSAKDKAGASSTSGVKRKASEMTASDPPAAAAAAPAPAAATAAVTAAPPVAPALARSDSSSSTASKRQKTDTEDGSLRVLRRRVVAELKDIVAEQEKGTLKGVGAAPRDGNLFVWDAFIKGPEGSPYEDGIFNLVITIPEEFPFKAPGVVFKTKIYHPNINGDGGICINILKEDWQSSFTIAKVLLALSALLSDPNPKDPLVPDIAKQMEHDKPAFEAKAREFTLKHARPTAATIKALESEAATGSTSSSTGAGAAATGGAAAKGGKR